MEMPQMSEELRNQLNDMRNADPEGFQLQMDTLRAHMLNPRYIDYWLCYANRLQPEEMEEMNDEMEDEDEDDEISLGSQDSEGLAPYDPDELQAIHAEIWRSAVRCAYGQMGFNIEDDDEGESTSSDEDESDDDEEGVIVLPCRNE